MTYVTIPNRPLGTDTRSIELLLADFDAITACINGELDPTNFSTSGAQSLHQPGDLICSAASSRVGCLLCDGSAVSRSTYSALFGAIGTAYGSGDGVSTFNLPNLVGRFMLGADAPAGSQYALGQGGGALGHTHVSPTVNVAAHSHPLSTAGGARLALGGQAGGGGGGAGYGNWQWGDTTSAGNFPATPNCRQMSLNTPAGGQMVVNYASVASGFDGVGLYGNTDSAGSQSISPGNTGGADPPYQAVNVFIKT